MPNSILTPRLNANDDAAEVAHWHVADGARVEVGQAVVDLASSKAVFTVHAEAAGYLQRLARIGQEVRVGVPVAMLHEKRETVAPVVDEKPGTGPSPVSGEGFGFTRFSKAALREIEARGLDPESFRGAGLVTTASLGKCHEGMRSEAISFSKKIEIEALTDGQSGNINSSLTVELSTEGLFRTMRAYQLLGGQLLPLVLYEFAGLLRQNPLFTAFYDERRIYFYDRVDLGIAIDFGEGLRVPVLRGADRLLPIDIQIAVTELAKRYLENTWQPSDFEGGTATVTDLSGENVRHFQPLLNRRQSVILGIGGDREMPGRPLTLTIVFDHRVLSGRQVAEFLSALRARLLRYVQPEATAEAARRPERGADAF